MQALPAWAMIASGVVVGFACGFTTKRAGLCSFGAIEDAWMSGDTSRLRTFGLALGIAMAATQAMIYLGLFDYRITAYVPTALPWLAIIIGSVLFGIGMALAGTCGYGLLIRLGCGDLRCLVVLLIFGATAYATLRGILAGFRVDILEQAAWLIPGTRNSDLISIANWYIGNGIELRPLIVGCATAFLLILAVANARLRRSPRLVIAGIVIGIGVATGWLITGVMIDEFEPGNRAQSLTFVAPIGKALYGAAFNPQGLVDFGVGSVVGVVLGAFSYARLKREFSWEAFDDHREMRRHILGAALMGFGGIIAGGCTIGQGVTAGSVMALSWPLAIFGFMIGARIGIAFLIEGSMAGVIAHQFGKFRQTGKATSD